jgi:type IV pilus assembly protein PilC
MSTYKYTAIDRRGKRIEGTLEAISREEVGHFIRKMGMKAIQIQPIKTRRKKFRLTRINITQPKVSASLKVIFFRELATMMNAGIQLVDALSILKLQFKDKYFNEAIGDICDQVKSGHPFSTALKQQSHIFPRLVISMVKAAEMGGGLGKILDQIAVYLEKEAETRKKLKSALSYPKFIMGFFVIVLVGVVFGLLPKFQEIFNSFDAELPGPTLAILASSNFIKDHLIIEVAILTAIVAGYKLFKNSDWGRQYIDKHIFSIPIAGPLIHMSVLIRMTQTLSALLKSGISLIDALKIAGETANNVYVDQVIEDISAQISRGKTFASQLQLYPDLFPVMVSSMINVGERSGALALMLGKIAEFNNRDFNARIDQLSKTMEPVIMGGLGVIICIIVLALYLPIFQMTSAIH